MSHKDKKVNLKDYKLGESIGGGAYGQVFRCVHKTTKREYAAKVSLVRSDDVNMDKIFDRELGSLLAVDHPCVIRLEGYSKTNFSGEKCPVILTEYMKNGSLYSAILKEYKSEPLADWNNTKKQIIFIGLAAGMKELHKNNIIHRDFKPDNVLLDSKLRPHIIDFGLSKILDPTSSVSMSTFSGTASYMAPELIVAEDDFSLPVDMYAFGFTIYELICGRPAYTKNNAVLGRIMKSVTAGQRPDFNYKCPPEFQKFIENCWCHAPNLRYTAEKAYNEAINNEKLLLPDVDLNEVSSYCREFLRVEPSYCKNRRKTLGGSSGDGVKRVSIKVPKAKTKPRAKTTDSIPDKKKGPAPDFMAQLSQSVNPSMFKRLTDSSFMTTFNETMKNSVFGHDSEMLTSTINATKADDPSLTTSISAKLDVLDKVKLLREPDPDASPELLFQIGNIYELGTRGRGINFERAAKFYKAAADKGHVNAMFNYANFLRDGVGVDEEDPAGAIKYFKKAAEHGCVEACSNLGRLFEEGEGCEKDVKEALHWYEKGAEKGSSAACFHAGRIYSIGCEEAEIPSDFKKAEKYLIIADKSGDVGFLPSIILSILYFKNDEDEKAIEFAKKAADGEIPLAQCLYGFLVIDSKPEEAAEYVEKAAVNSVAPAMFILGHLYYNGIGVEKDLKKSAEWFKNSADAGDSAGELRYSMALLDGVGVDQDIEEGARYLRKSAKNGNTLACVFLFFHTAILKTFEVEEDDSLPLAKAILILPLIIGD